MIVSLVEVAALYQLFQVFKLRCLQHRREAGRTVAKRVRQHNHGFGQLTDFRTTNRLHQSRNCYFSAIALGARTGALPQWKMHVLHDACLIVVAPINCELELFARRCLWPTEQCDPVTESNCGESPQPFTARWDPSQLCTLLN